MTASIIDGAKRDFYSYSISHGLSLQNHRHIANCFHIKESTFSRKQK